MINLKEEIYYEYIDDIKVEIFNKYKWALIRLGINFDREILEAIVYCPSNLENVFKAFCAWVLWLKNKGEKPESEILKETLLKALNDGWTPFKFQEKFLQKYQDLFINSQDFFWQQAQKYLGNELRNKLIADILENGTIIYHNNINFHNLSEEDLDNLSEFKIYIANFLAL